MSNYAILRFKKLKNFGAVSAVESHNARTRSVKNSNPQKENQQLCGSDDVVKNIKELWSKHKIKPRKNAVLAVEYVLTGSPEIMHNMNDVELKKWADASFDFIKKKHGDGVLAAWLHLDESTPHLHILITPILEKIVRGKLQIRLSAKDFFDGRERLSSMQDDYAKHMKNFGLSRGIKGSSANHRTIKNYYRNLLQDLHKTQKIADKYQLNISEPNIFNFKKIIGSLKEKVKVLVKKLAALAGEADRYKQLNQELKIQIGRLTLKLRGSDSAKTELELEQVKQSLELSQQKAREAVQTQIQQQQTISDQTQVMNMMRNKIKTLQSTHEYVR